MITLLARRHLYDEDGLDVAIVHVSVTTSAELSDVSTYLQSKGIKLHEGSKAWDITNSIQYGFTTDGNWHQWETGTSIVTLKGRVDTVNNLPSNAQPGWMYFVGLSTDTELEEYVYTDAERWEHVGTTAITIDSALSTTSENPVQNKVITNALDEKVDKVSGKGLSTEDYTTPEKTKLATIESAANKTIVDSELSGISENPVQNKVITAALINNPIKRFGFRIDQNNSDPNTCVEYLYDAVGMTPAYMDFTNSVFEYGSWQNVWFIKDAYPVALKFDGTEDYKLDPNDYTKKIDGTPSDIYDSTYQGNFMMAFPRVWFKRYEVGGYNYIEVSNVQLDENFKAWAHIDENGDLKDYIYIPLFKGAVIDGRLRSIAGVTPSGFTTTQQEIDAASACGNGWQIWDWLSREMLSDLLVLISKSIDSQVKFGKGQESGYDSSDTRTYGKLSTGSLVDKGLFFGYNNSISEVKVFGIEGFWGNRFDRILGLLLVDGVWKTKFSPPYNLTGSGYTTHSDFVCPDSGWLTVAQTSEYGSIPKSVGGSVSTYYADYFYSTKTGTRVARCGGSCSYGSGCGSRSFNVDNAATASGWYIGASPVKK